MKCRTTACLLLLAAASQSFAQDAQERVRLRSAIVVVSDNPDLGREIEQGAVERANANDYDAEASYALTPKDFEARQHGLLQDLASRNIQTLLVLSPLSVGRGASLDALRATLSPDVFKSIQAYAAEFGKSGGRNLVAVMQIAIYVLGDDGLDLLSQGAVWLDDEVATQDEAVARLLDLVLKNVDSIRPAIRRHLGLAPLN